MTQFGIFAAVLLVKLVILALVGTDVLNTAGSAAINDSFVRWDRPRWRHLTTGGLGVLAAAPIKHCAASYNQRGAD